MPFWFYFFRKSHKGYPARAVSKNRLESGKWTQPKQVKCFLGHLLSIASWSPSSQQEEQLSLYTCFFTVTVKETWCDFSHSGGYQKPADAHQDWRVVFFIDQQNRFQRIFLRGIGSWHYSFYSTVKTGKKLHISVMTTQLNPW